MARTATQHIDLRIGQKPISIWSDYLVLIKMRLTTLVVFTAISSFLIASELQFTWLQILLLGIGGFGVAGASNTLNQVLEKDYDKLMQRTMNRPVTAGRMTVSHAVLFAGVLCLVGITALSMFNVWASFLGMLAFVTYAFVYTPLKRHSRAAVLVGAIAGAMPMAIGVVAYSGELTLLAVLLFSIQFAWQYPHFWAIGFLGHEDYKKAGFNFVPMAGQKPCRSISWVSVLYCIVLLLLPLILIQLGYVGVTGGVSIVVLALVYLWYAVSFYRHFNMASAKKLMFSSLLYIPFVMIILIIDKI